MRLEFIQIIDRLPESDCKDLCTNFRGRKSLHDHSLKTVKICVHCTQIFTLCKDLHCKDLRPPTVDFYASIYSGVRVILAIKIPKKLENYPNRHKLPVPTLFLQYP